MPALLETGGDNESLDPAIFGRLHFLISRPYSADTSGLYAVYIPLNADGFRCRPYGEDMKLIPVENQKTLDVTMEGAEGNPVL